MEAASITERPTLAASPIGSCGALKELPRSTCMVRNRGATSASGVSE